MLSIDLTNCFVDCSACGRSLKVASTRDVLKVCTCGKQVVVDGGDMAFFVASSASTPTVQEFPAAGHELT